MLYSKEGLGSAADRARERVVCSACPELTGLESGRAAEVRSIDAYLGEASKIMASTGGRAWSPPRCGRG